MIRKGYEKSEIGFAIAWILIYVMVMGNMQASFGIGSLPSLLCLLLISGALLLFMIRNGLSLKYGLVPITQWKRYLFYLPLLLIGTVNLWFGVKGHYDPFHQLLAAGAMALSGLAEELIFRGLLFRAIEKTSLKEAIVITSVTFGAGHFVNLFTGAPVLETVLQILYAIAIGFAFVMVFYRSRSLVPCILTHSLINITAEFSGEGSTAWMYLQVIFLILVAGGYALYLYKIGPQEEGGIRSCE